MNIKFFLDFREVMVGVRLTSEIWRVDPLQPVEEVDHPCTHLMPLSSRILWFEVPLVESDFAVRFGRQTSACPRRVTLVDDHAAIIAPARPEHAQRSGTPAVRDAVVVALLARPELVLVFENRTGRFAIRPVLHVLARITITRFLEI